MRLYLKERLNLKDRRKLRQIDKEVRRTDPRLASLLAMFSRLAAGEPMPAHERLHAPDNHGRHLMMPG